MFPHRAPPFFRRLARWMVVATICLSLGLQWAALQGIAWTGMLISFAKEGSLAEAVVKTFDGAHPCPMCKAVEEGTKKDQSTTLKSPLKKIEALVVQEFTLIPPSGESLNYPTFDEQGTQRPTLPAGKPPRTVVA